MREIRMLRTMWRKPPATATPRPCDHRASFRPYKELCRPLRAMEVHLQGLQVSFFELAEVDLIANDGSV